MNTELQRVICGDSFAELTEYYGAAHLVICDPGYGDIIDEPWDVAEYERWFGLCDNLARPEATIAIWGGIGKRQNRPFLEFEFRDYGDDPDLRIALCGYEGEHEMPASWTVHAWKGARGYASEDNDNRSKERIWFSPHCLPIEVQRSLFESANGGV